MNNQWQSKNTIEDMKISMYITNILTATFPLELLTDHILAEIGIGKGMSLGVIQIYFSHQLQNTVDSRPKESVANWKKQISDQFLGYLANDFTSPLCILNLAPYTRTIIYTFDPAHVSSLENHLRHWFHNVSTYLTMNNYGPITAFADPSLVQINTLEPKYKQLRSLKDYRMVLGLDSLTFYQQLQKANPLTSLDFRELNQYKTLLSINDYTKAKEVISSLNEHIIDHQLPDTKIIYLYQEIFATTVKHLYQRDFISSELIHELNECMALFESRFEDLTMVKDYLINLLESLYTLDSTKGLTLHPHIRKTLQILQSEYATNIGLGEIAIRLKLSEAYLSRLFKENLGIGFKEYLTNYRLNIIKDLLQNSSKSIITIAKETGYSSPNQLTRIFKKYEHMTPSAYRHKAIGHS